MRIGILTFHRAYNCGAMLQAWALQTVLTRLGHNVEFPDFQSVGRVGRFYGLHAPRAFSKPWLYLLWLRDLLCSIGVCDYKRYRFRRFMNRYINHHKRRLSDVDTVYDVLMVGSDQVWNPSVSGQMLSLFLCEGLSCKTPAVGYAISIGDSVLPECYYERMRESAKRFKVISFREESSRDIIDAESRLGAKVVLDPTLLLLSADYKRIPERGISDRPYLYVYATPSLKMLEAARELSKALGLRLIVGYFYTATINFGIREMQYDLSPDTLVNSIRGASYVITNSFHGTALSIVFGKKFISFANSDSVIRSRIQCLLERLCASDRIVSEASAISDMKDRLMAEVPSCVYRRLDECRSAAMAYILKALK